MRENPRRWFRPAIPCMLAGAFIGWTPSVNGDQTTDAIETVVGAAVGLFVGLVLDHVIRDKRRLPDEDSKKSAP